MSDKVINDLVKVYRRLRDAVAELEEEHKAKLAELKYQMDLVSQNLLEFCERHNLDSVRTPMGTVSRRVQTRYWTNDWESLYKCVEENGAYHLLEKRINNHNMKEFLEENPDILPPGLQVDRKYIVQVRKPNRKDT
jgi:hypothetical protein